MSSHQRLTVSTQTHHVENRHVGVVAQSGRHGQSAAGGVDVEELVDVGRFRLSTVNEVGDVTVISLKDQRPLSGDSLSDTHTSTKPIVGERFHHAHKTRSMQRDVANCL